jgi:hypothetical protein
MPPRAVRSLRDLIFWQYAKIISESAGFGKANYAFINEAEAQKGKMIDDGYATTLVGWATSWM